MAVTQLTCLAVGVDSLLVTVTQLTCLAVGVDPLLVTVTLSWLVAHAVVHAERVFSISAQLRRTLARVTVHNVAFLTQARET